MLIADRYGDLLNALNSAPLYLPFVKIVHAFAMREFDDYDFANLKALRDHWDIQSTTKQKANKIDFVFVSFYANDKSKAICIQRYIKNFKLTAENAGAQTYLADSIVMNTWNDPVQYQMMMDAITFSNNAMVRFPREFINSCKAEIIVTAPVANGIATTATDIPKQYLPDFLLAIPFAADSTHMEGLTRTGNDVTWITNGIVQYQPFHSANGAATTCQNILAPRCIVFSNVCD
jgi:hypothetical protein